MQIQQIQTNTEQVNGVKVSTAASPAVAKSQETGFFAPVAAAEEEMSLGGLERKAKSITESQTTNHAEYVAGVMNDSLVEKADQEGVDLSEEDEKALVTVVDKIQMELIEGGNTDVAQIADLSVEELSSMAPSVTAAYEMAQKLISPTQEEICYLAGNGLEPSIGNFYQAQSVVAGMEETGPKSSMKLDSDLTEQIRQRMEELSIEETPESLNRAIYMVQNGVDLTRENYDYIAELEKVALPASDQEILTSIQDAVILGRTATAGMLLPGYSWQERSMSAMEVVAEATPEDLETLIREDKEITLANLSTVIADRESGTEGSDIDSDQIGEVKPEAESTYAGVAGEDTGSAYKLVAARRSLEQVRLYMTAQANLSLLKQGIHIETEPLEQLVEELKRQEEALEKALYGGSESVDGVSREQQFTDTNAVLMEMKAAPAYMLEVISMEDSLYKAGQTVAEAGKNPEEQAAYAKANGAYETMMTKVRTDLGDSIQKAFRNVDDILEDLGLETNSANERAVRILAYNQTELSVENIAGMKQKDEQVQTLFHAMTPKVVLSMIREGYNPLDHSLEELNAKAEEIRNTIDGKDTERYSKFLVQLEQQGEISEQERNSFVAIYRLLRQVEKSDGAAVGAVVLSGEKLTMRNLMTQVRSMRSGGIDISASDENGQRAEDYVADLSITQQIEAAYQTSCVENALYEITPGKLLASDNQAETGADLMDLTPEQLLEAMRKVAEGNNAAAEEIYDEQQQQIRQAYAAINSNRDLEDFFRQYDVPKSAANIQAVAEFLKDRNKLYQSLYSRQSRQQELMEEIGDIKEDIWEHFSEAVKTPEDMAEAQKTLAETAEQVMEGMLDQEEVTSLDLRQMKIESRQMGILTQLGEKEEYAVPVLVADEMGCVSLKIVRGKEEKGKVCITTKTRAFGKLAAEFSMTDRGVKGYLATDTRKAGEEFRQEDEAFCQRLTEELKDVGIDLKDKPEIAYVTSENLSLEQFYRGSGTGGEPSGEVQTRTLYTFARVFLKTLSELGATKLV